MNGLIILFIAMALAGLLIEIFSGVIALITNSETGLQIAFAGAIIGLSGLSLLIVTAFVKLVIGLVIGGLE